MISFAAIDKENNGNYLKQLSAVSKLSGLFSESSVPYINYRVVENIFCKSFNADNLSRSDTAFDANYNSLGVGIKTFVCLSNGKMEKIAEFNSLSKKLSKYKEKNLAIKLAEFRNERIELAKRLYNIKDAVYHIVARKENKLYLFETAYEKIDIDKIRNVKQNDTSLKFNDTKNDYSFNFSKSTLFQNFIIPGNAFVLPIDILEDPYTLLLSLLKDSSLQSATQKLVRGKNYIILPLYGLKKCRLTKSKEKFVFEKSGLNQWNAGGRKRDPGEVYIPIPKEIHKYFPDFFPQRDKDFELKIPTGEAFKAKVCQDNSKALMTNPNKALADWLLRGVFQLNERERLTIDKVNMLGFDSVIIYKDSEGKYRIDKAKLDSYENFISKTM
jgi:hypothetical protein